LPLYNYVNKEITAYFNELSHNDSINDKKVQRDSMAKTDEKRVSFRKTSDSILYEYANKYPTSPIISWLLFDAAWTHYYSDYYYKAFEKISLYAPANINKELKAFLDVQKTKGVGKVFPLLDFIRANIGDEGKKAKYTLVDFWFSGCGPCIRKFNELKETYKEFHDKGFNIVAISSDKKESLPNYERVIKKFQYTWDLVLDLDGVKTKSININQFPSTFLLDSQGKIIQTHINPVLLNAFLEKNL
jgi:thiol-disulfide isomerase/thioredoxin